MRSTSATLVADASVPGRTVTLVGFDLGDSDWPLKASFVLFVRNLVELARIHRAQGIAGPARTGEPLRVAVPDATPDAVEVERSGLPRRASVATAAASRSSRRSIARGSTASAGKDRTAGARSSPRT